MVQQICYCTCFMVARFGWRSGFDEGNEFFGVKASRIGSKINGGSEFGV
jgi:hypothetical protein